MVVLWYGVVSIYYLIVSPIFDTLHPLGCGMQSVKFRVVVCVNVCCGFEVLSFSQVFEVFEVFTVWCSAVWCAVPQHSTPYHTPSEHTAPYHITPYHYNISYSHISMQIHEYTTVPLYSTTILYYYISIPLYYYTSK